MSHDHAILQAVAPDAALIAPLFDAYRRFYAKPAALDDCTRWIHDRLAQQQATIYVAFMPQTCTPAHPPLCAPDPRGLPAGIAVLYPTFSSVALTPRITLNDLFVDPAFRRHGLARQLMLRCMLHATEHNAQLQLLTAHTNTSAQALYASVGWKRDEDYQRWTWTPPR